jgi:hypothetical protein
MSNEDISREEAASMALAMTAPGSPGSLVSGFLQAIQEGRFEEARLDCHEACGPGLPEAIATIGFIQSGHWGIWGMPEITDQGDQLVRVVQLEDDELAQPTHVEAGTPLRVLTFLVRFSDGMWSILSVNRGDKP